MKKFLSIVMMALAVAFASCSGNSSRYTQGGPEPTIDNDAHSVNGVVYDNTTDKCWKLHTTYHYYVTVSTDSYLWGTEFYAHSVAEYTMWEFAQAGYGSASYTLTVTTIANSEDCLNKNSED